MGVTLVDCERCYCRDHKPGLGDVAKAALAAVGINQQLLVAWTGQPCGCEQRRLKLNRLGSWVSGVVKRLMGK